ncbi:MAG: four helix bundle protein [Chitinophagales bacterium]
MQNLKENLVVKLTFEFALEIVAYTDLLRSLHKYKMADQLFDSGTSIGANSREAQNAESKNDFIHKMKIAAKEADETDYWLLLCKNSTGYPNPDHLLEKFVSIIKILSKIIGTSKRTTK